MFHHVTVLKDEAVEGLAIAPEGCYVDCTLGGGGHSEAIAQRLVAGGKLIALDQDESALRHARERLRPYIGRVSFVKSNFRHLKQALIDQGVSCTGGIPQVNGILFDLGVSSPQLDEADRGFSYNQDAELDMRMDREAELSAYHVVNEWDEAELARILRDYGEERFARSIARRIVQRRSQSPIRTTGGLAEIIRDSIPAPARRTGPHPAKRSFQAIRIAVNDELGAFEDALGQAVECLAPGGRIAVITFHSLEDRLCKRFFAKFVGKCTCPPDFPVCVCRNKGILRLITRKPILPSEAELEANPRARSAKLRIAEKVGEGLK